METATKRPRGRPRTQAPPRPIVHVRMPAALKAQLERDAQEANRSLTKEIEVRLEQSYSRDELYGGSRMASMFREMAEIALGVAKRKNRGSFFEDFAVFVFVRDVWRMILQRQMPRPDEKLLAEVCREWDALKSESLQTATQQAAREWLIHQTPMTLVQALAGTFEPAIGRSAGPREPTHGQPVTPEPTEAGETAMQPKSQFSAGTAPPIGSLGKALETLVGSENPASTAFSGGEVWPVGGIAKVMEGLLPSQGSARAAAGEVSRLAQLLAGATEEFSVSETAIPRIEPNAGVVAVRK